jgi:hypothetical protein
MSMSPARALMVGLFGVLLVAAGCRESGPTPPPDGAAAGPRVVGNCVMTPSLCPSRYCLPQHDGTFLCACTDVPDGQACSPCPAGYRYHTKFSSCEPTCEVVAPTCKTGEVCGDLEGVAVCQPADAGDGGTAG